MKVAVTKEMSQSWRKFFNDKENVLTKFKMNSNCPGKKFVKYLLIEHRDFKVKMNGLGCQRPRAIQRKHMKISKEKSKRLSKSYRVQLGSLVQAVSTTQELLKVKQFSTIVKTIEIQTICTIPQGRLRSQHNNEWQHHMELHSR